MTSATAFVDIAAHPAAVPYYRLFPPEPIPAAGAFTNVERVVELKDIKVETLLGAIVKGVKKGGSIVIVCHGNDHGLRFSVGERRAMRLEAGNLRVILSNLAQTHSDFDTAQFLKFGDFNAPSNDKGVKQVVALRAQIQAVHKLELDRVDLRACETGKDPAVLRQLQAFFNCATLCAPKAFDSFGPIPMGQTTTNPAVWSKWLQEHPNAVVEDIGWQQRFALDYKILGGEQRVMLAALADTQEAVLAWVRKHLPKGSYSKGPLFYHGLTADLQTMIWAGDPDYRGQLVEVQKGQFTPTVTIDPNAPLPRP
jgi:hypothetical protein